MLYQYRAVKDNVVEERTIEAESEDEVVDYLRRHDYFLIHVRSSKGNAFGFLTPLLHRITRRDIVDITRQLSIMMVAGLTIVQGLDILKKQQPKEDLRVVIDDIEKQIKAGNTFSFALRRYPQYFSNLYIALIKSGEATGKLAEVLTKLSDNLEKEQEVKGRLKNALIYPTIVIIAMFIVMFIMMTFVVPKMLDLYKEFNSQLPFTTRSLIFVSGIFVHYWPIIIIGTGVGTYFLLTYMRTKKGKRMFDKVMLSIPKVKTVVSISALVNSTRTLSILIGSGVSILEALTIIVETTDNILYQESFRRIYKEVEKGRSLGAAFSNETIFPPILVQMTVIGENTGHLDETLMRISHYFETESELAVKAMTTLIEPTILVVLGVGVGFIVLSIITPLYNLTSSFK
ncbi:type II secretion system F family protein [Candidatus Microgenomates bacterium]|nr:type II secretion system F family protein [Candidatus Microgenomates bacterium]